ncbi:MAG: ATP-dependent helicase [Coprococcus sp.]|nr:ATP-dependent helicase [Coprococcus sp.]
MMNRFDDNQIKAISHYNGPLLVVAGPGSGKTTVITHRVQNLIENHHVKPENILVITYTRAAAEEMHSRFETLMPYSHGVCFGTFHSVFFRILRAAYQYSGSDIITEGDKYDLIRKIIQENHFNYDSQEDFLKNIISEISFVKCENSISKNYTSKNMKNEDFDILYRSYNKYLIENNKLDFDDMLIDTYELFVNRPDILKKWQDIFKYILVDEFQDINRLQYEIVKLLAGKRRNIFVVGDDDQSVYSFRGASPDIMKELKSDYKDMDMIYLSVNYRCSQDIVCCADRIIRHNTKRFDKKIVSAFSGEKRERIHVIPVSDQKEEYADIIARIMDISKKGIPFSQIAVLHRTNMESRGLASKLMEYNIPFKANDSVQNIFTHFVSRNIFDYIYLSLGDRSRKRFLSVINRPNRYIGRDALWGEEVNFDALREFYKDNRRIQNNINIFENDLARIKNLKPYAAVNYIRRACGYDDYIKEYADYRGIDKADYLDILDDLMESAREFDSYENWFSYIKEYTETINEQKRKWDKDKDAVTITTMHSAKGLEFDQVFILNAAEGITPHKKSVTESELEEERRIFYVAVTRARYGLYIYTPRVIYGKTADVSRFVHEMIIDYDVLKVGNKIVHKRYGVGTITFVDDKRIGVMFDETGVVKTLSIEYSLGNGLISVPESD